MRLTYPVEREPTHMSQATGGPSRWQLLSRGTLEDGSTWYLSTVFLDAGYPGGDYETLLSFDGFSDPIDRHATRLEAKYYHLNQLAIVEWMLETGQRMPNEDPDTAWSSQWDMLHTWALMAKEAGVRFYRMPIPCTVCCESRDIVRESSVSGLDYTDPSVMAQQMIENLANMLAPLPRCGKCGEEVTHLHFDFVSTKEDV